MDKYIKVNTLTYLREHFAGSVTGETVAIRIRKDSNGYWWNFSTTAFAAAEASGSMTFDADGTWKASFTPDAEGTYSVWMTYDSGTLFHSIEAVGKPAPESIAGSEVTIAEVKEAIGIAGTAQDTILATLLARVTEDIENNVIFRKLSVQTHTDYYNGGGQSVLSLRQYPVISVTSIHDDLEHAYGADTLIDATDYTVFLDTGMVSLDNFIFMDGYNNVKVVYSAGYSTFPRDLKEAIIKMTYAEYLTLRASGNVIEGSNEDKPKRLREEALKSLQQYVRMR